MCCGIVHALEHDILERESALMCEVVVTHQVYHLYDRHTTLCRHQLRTLFWYWRVHTDSNMTITLVEEALQFLAYAYAAHCDALRAPSVAIVGSHHLCYLQYVVEVVHRFALAHKHNVRKLLAFGQRVYLIENVGCCEALLKALLACLAEQAIHFTTHL